LRLLRLLRLLLLLLLLLLPQQLGTVTIRSLRQKTVNG
jgi:hypothetical protein